jgi:hypothetical protein
VDPKPYREPFMLLIMQIATASAVVALCIVVYKSLTNE